MKAQIIIPVGWVALKPGAKLQRGDRLFHYEWQEMKPARWVRVDSGMGCEAQKHYKTIRKITPLS